MSKFYKEKKFLPTEKYFQEIIDSKNKIIKQLNDSNNELLNEKYRLIKENEELKSKVDYVNNVIEQLLKLNDLSPGNIKILMDKATKINIACDLLTNKVIKDLMKGN